MFVWDEKKRLLNLEKHKLDFVLAPSVYNHPQKVVQRSARHGEERYADIAVVDALGIWLTLIYARRGADIRVISLRNALRDKRSFHTQSPEPD